MSTLRQRSHHGCWTCKARRRKCDNTRPSCQACIQRGLHCEGYGVRLRWGAGIASRGRYTGAEEPIEASVPPRRKGRRRDLSRERRRNQQGEAYMVDVEKASATPSTSESNSAGTRAKFLAVVTSGVNTLHSTETNDPRSLLGAQLPELCQQSDALYFICLALQVSINEDIRPRFFEYYDAALNHFRTELAHSTSYLPDGTLAAGLLLCSVGVLRGTPWTMHLRGMYNIIQSQGFQNLRSEVSAFRIHLFEVMGVMDIPTFAIGRQNPCLGFWRNHCRERNDPTPVNSKLGHDVEVVSGLPRSLLDIFSCIGNGGATEEEFWDWPGAQGTLLQCQLWEAYRSAGILAVRHRQLHRFDELLVPQTDSSHQKEQRKRTLPTTEVLVLRIFSNLDAIFRAAREPGGTEFLLLNAVFYPLVVAALQTSVLNERSYLKDLMKTWSDNPHYPPGNERLLQILWEILEEWWESDPFKTSIHDLAYMRGLEVALY
ncbi:Zn(II)2Cys6 transcription factor [Aspergillus homomorphus CBS 101889]|uniref:C6 finger domain protein n=1 Tax=Aspergillus homomorphus (strain CBS 101889) TaxID=1450537 RepID=A0A395HKE2_ASPHC|nr:C6 finger domain protein [Aspergillus homomorphus CBS 101889]RAL07398.1 C6 finger domain protein [Aspergillus homomorphus CBS 101889]